MPIRKTLPSGLRVELDDNLDPYALATGAVNVPNSALGDILSLLTGGDFSPVPELQTENNKAYIRGIYELCALWMTAPRLVLKGTPPKGAIRPGPAFSWGDAVAVWNFFRLGDGTFVGAAADHEPGESAAADTNSAAVEQSAE